MKWGKTVAGEDTEVKDISFIRVEIWGIESHDGIDRSNLEEKIGNLESTCYSQKNQGRVRNGSAFFIILRLVWRRFNIHKNLLELPCSAPIMLYTLKWKWKGKLWKINSLLVDVANINQESLCQVMLNHAKISFWYIFCSFTKGIDEAWGKSDIHWYRTLSIW